jgi:hypothetical protein
LNKFKKVLLEFLFFSKQEIPSRILRKIWNGFSNKSFE